MESPNDYNVRLDNKVIKPTAADNEGTGAIPLSFYDADRYAFISIDPVIVGKLGLTRDDLFVQEVVPEGILLRRFKETI